MKTLASILLLVLFGWYSIGFIMQTRLQIKAVKREMRRSIKAGDFLANEVVEIQFSAADFANSNTAPRIVNSHEFEYRGMMYDVVNARFDKGRLIMKCIPDHRENQMVAWFVRFTKDKNDNNKKFNGNTAFSFGHFGMAHAVIVPSCPEADQVHHSSQLQDMLPAGHFNLPSPPPWFKSVPC